MVEKKLVKLEFINKRNELKKVEFYMDKQSYEILEDETISKEERQRYLIDEYHEYEREKYHNRKIVSLDNKNIALFNEMIDESETPEQKYIRENETKNFFSFLGELNERQKELIKLIYFEGKSQEEVAKKYGISESAISHALSRIYKKIKKFIKDRQLF